MHLVPTLIEGGWSASVRPIVSLGQMVETSIWGNAAPPFPPSLVVLRGLSVEASLAPLGPYP